MKFKIAAVALRFCNFMEKLFRNWSNWFGGKGSFIIGKWM